MGKYLLLKDMNKTKQLVLVIQGKFYKKDVWAKWTQRGTIGFYNNTHRLGWWYIYNIFIISL